MKKIFIDTDMGYDDIVAILILLLSSTVEIGGISTVSGVSSSEKGIKNLQKILSYLNITIPLVKGRAIRAIPRFPKTDSLRSEKLSLLQGLNIPKYPLQVNKINDLKNFFDKTDERFTILALGPLTNIAYLVDTYPDKISDLVIMGGGILKGNVPPDYRAEYNILLDPESANKVFRSTIPTTMLGIDATSNVPATQEFRKKIKQMRPTNNEGKIIREIIINNNNDFKEYYDPLAAALLTNLKLVKKSVKTSIKVILNGPQRGRTLLDKRGTKNTRVILEVDADQFYDQIFDIFRRSQ